MDNYENQNGQDVGYSEVGKMLKGVSTFVSNTQKGVSDDVQVFRVGDVPLNDAKYEPHFSASQASYTPQTSNTPQETSASQSSYDARSSQSGYTPSYTQPQSSYEAGSQSTQPAYSAPQNGYESSHKSPENGSNPFTSTAGSSSTGYDPHQAIYNAVQNSPNTGSANESIAFDKSYIKDGKINNDNSEALAGHGQQAAAVIDNGNFEQSDVGQGHKKITEFGSILMAVHANHEVNQIGRVYDNIDFKELGISDLYNQSTERMNQYLSIAQIDGQSGYMWQSETKMNDLKFGIGDTTVGKVDAQVRCPDGTTMSLSQLKDSNPASLGFDIEDCKMIRYDGVVTGLSVKDFEKMDLSSLAKQAQADQDALVRIASARSLPEKRLALEEIRGKQLESLANSNPAIRRTIDMYKNSPEKINGELMKLAKSGKLSDAEIKNISNYLKSGGEMSDIGSALGSEGKKGANLLKEKTTNFVLGNSEFGTTVKMIDRTRKALNKTIYAAEKFSYKRGVRVATKKVNKAQKKIEKVGKEGVKGQKAAQKLSKAQELVDKKTEAFNKFNDRAKYSRFSPAYDKNHRKLVDAKNRQQKRKEKFEKTTKRLDEKTKALEQRYAKLKKNQDELVGKVFQNNTKSQMRQNKKLINGLNKDTKATSKKLAQLKQRQAQRLKKAQEAAQKAAARKAKNQAAEKVLSEAAAKVAETVAGVKKYIYIILAIIIAFVLCIEIIGAILCAIGGVIGAIISFNPIDELRGAVTPTDFQAQLDNINYNQYIVDKVSTELSQSFISVAKKDAQNHFLLRARIPNMDGYYWYMDVVEGEVGNVWMREQEDNVSTLDGNGFVSGYTTRGWVHISGTGASRPTTNATYNNAVHPAYRVSNASYIMDPNARKRLKSVNSNVLPIVAMANYRFTEGIDYSSFCDVMAYVYYMYVQSHDIAKYDSENEDETYYAEVSTKCKIYNAATGKWVDKIYDGQAERRWVTSSNGTEGKVAVPTMSAVCSNIYIHGYDRMWGATLMAAKAEAQEFCTDVENWLRNNYDNIFNGTIFERNTDIQKEQIPVGTELVRRNANGTYTFSGNTTNCSWHVEYLGDVYSTAGMGNIELDANNESDLDRDGELYRYHQTASAFVDQNGTLVCNNIGYYQWSSFEGTVATNTVVSATDTVVTNGIYSNGSEWHGVTCGYKAHRHYNISYDNNLGCISRTCQYAEHTHNLFCSCNLGKPYHSQNQHDQGIGCTWQEPTHYDSCYTMVTKYYKVTTTTKELWIQGRLWNSTSSSVPEEISEYAYRNMSGSSTTSSQGAIKTIVTVSKTSSQERSNTLRGNCGHTRYKTCSVHVHTDDCCPTPEHKHITLSASVMNAVREKCIALNGSGIPADGTFIVYAIGALTEEPAEWSFTSDGIFAASYSALYGNYKSCTYSIDRCDLPEHTHKQVVWNTYTDESGNTVENHGKFPSDPGCYQIIAVCQGHCGGHLKPVINVVVTDTFEGLMIIDNFKMTSCVSWMDFSSASTAVSTMLMPTVGTWKLYWNTKAAAWFSPFPSSPAAGMAYVSQKALYWEAGFMDTLTSWISTQDDGDVSYEVDETVESVDAFDGWWTSEYNVDVEKLDYLKSLYGDWNDESGEYSYGVEMFASDAFQVVFPMGINKCVDYGEEMEIIRQLTEAGISERQMNMAKDALHKAGAFYYSDSLYARQNAATQSSGASDLSGFVLGIFNNVNTRHNTMVPFGARGEYASGYTVGLCSSTYSEAYDGGAVQTGDVLLSEENGIACVVIGNIYNEETNTTQLKCVVISELAGGTKLDVLNKSRFDRIIHYNKTSF